MLLAGSMSHNSIHLLIITTDFVHFTNLLDMSFSLLHHFFASVESGDQCLLNPEVLSCFFLGL